MKIVVGGQLRKEEIKNLILNLNPKVVVDIKSDMDAAFAIQSNEYDYYVGSCDTGGGGALAIAISLLGIDKARTISTQSSKKTKKEILEMLKNGVVAFGFVENQYEYSIKTLLECIMEVRNE